MYAYLWGINEIHIHADERGLKRLLKKASILFSVANNTSYGSKRMKEVGMKVPSRVFHHLDKLKMEEVLSAFCKVNSDVLKRKGKELYVQLHKMPGKNRDVVGMENAGGQAMVMQV